MTENGSSWEFWWIPLGLLFCIGMWVWSWMGRPELVQRKALRTSDGALWVGVIAWSVAATIVLLLIMKGCDK